MSTRVKGFFDRLKARTGKGSENDAISQTSASSSVSGSNAYQGPLSPTSEVCQFHESPSFSCGVLELLDEDDQFRQVPSTSWNLSASEQTVVPDRNESEGDLGQSVMASGPLRRRSRLSKSFSEVLKDPGALGYFIQYMDSRRLGHLVKFYLAAESFRISASSVYCKKDLETFENVDTQNSAADAVDRYGAVDKRTASSGNSSSTLSCAATKSSASAGDLESGKGNDSGISLGLKEMTERDAVSIFAKFIGKDASSNIGVTESIRNAVINKICCENGCLEPDCFMPAQQFVHQIMENRYFPEFIGSLYYCKHQVDVLTSGAVTLTDILFNESALSYFTEFLDQEGQRRFVAFWLSADSFRQDLIRRQGIYSGMEAQTDAMVLYDKYFSMQGTEPLNLGEGVRFEVENNICREGGPLPDCFETPSRIVYAKLEREFLPRFLHCSLFVKYLSELIHTIKNTPELPDPYKPRAKRGSTTGSDLSSGDMSIGSSLSLEGRIRNTLLAQESPQAIARRRQVSQVSSDQISLDTASYSPQDLYERPSSKLSLGKMDQFGQYLRDYDDRTLPNARKGRKLADKMKKIVNKDTKEQEDLALQVAQLIINDVAQMTQNPDIQ